MIKLTYTWNKRPVWINPAQVTCVSTDRNPGTLVFFPGGEEDLIRVTEPVELVADLIAEALAIPNHSR